MIIEGNMPDKPWRDITYGEYQNLGIYIIVAGNTNEIEESDKFVKKNIYIYI